MSYPVILKKNNKFLKEFKTIKELAQFIKWDYNILYYYIVKNKRTEDGFTFKIDWAKIKATQNDFVKKLNEHYIKWWRSKRYGTARYHAEEYMGYVNDILQEIETYKKTIIKLKPINQEMPYFNYLKDICKFQEYNKRLIEIQSKAKLVNQPHLIAINNQRIKLQTALKYIKSEHLSQYVKVDKNQITINTEDIEKIPTIVLSKEDRLSIVCLRELCKTLNGNFS